MKVQVILQFETCEDEHATDQDIDRLEDWVHGTMDNAPMDEEVGFPDCFESYATVLGITIVQERPKSNAEI